VEDYSSNPRPLYPDRLARLAARSDFQSSRTRRTSSISFRLVALAESDRDMMYLLERPPSMLNSSAPSSPDRTLIFFRSRLSPLNPIRTPWIVMVMLLLSSSWREPTPLPLLVLVSLARLLLSDRVLELPLSLSGRWLRRARASAVSGVARLARWYSSASRCFCSRSRGRSTP
jgi:hypothetical protein